MVKSKQHSHKNIILFLLALTMFLVVLDSAIVNVALPKIKEALHFDEASLQWVLTSYVLAFGGFLMLGGRTADLYGRKKVLMIGTAGFTLFSLLIGLSHTSLMLIVLRALQGLAAAFMAPTALSLLLTTFSEGDERNNALSVWSLVASGGAAAGVFLGGLLTQFLGWQWCFFVNVPIGILAILGMRKYIPEQSKDSASRHLDLPGAVLITGGLISLVYGLTLAAQIGWTAMASLTSFGMSIVLLSAFVFNESKATHPLVPLGIFKVRNVVGANLMMLPIVAGALGQFFFLSLYVQNVLQYSPVISGLCFLPIPIVIGIISRQAPKLLNKFGFKPLVVVGVALATIGVFWMSFLGTQANYWTQMLPGFLILAVGMGISFVAVTVAATAGVSHDKAGLASGLINTSQQVGSALGLAVLSVIAASSTEAAQQAGKNLIEASVIGYQHAFQIAALLMFIALLIAIFVIQTPKEKKKTQKAKIAK